MWSRLTWLIAGASCAGYLVALQIGPGCAETVAPWAGGAFFAAFFGAVFLNEWKGRR